MKVWQSFGSEHSANLVMIGHFSSEASATAALAEIETLCQKANDDLASGLLDPYDGSLRRHTDRLLDVAKELDFWDVNPTDYASFIHNLTAKRSGSRLEFYTEESDIMGYVKFMLNRGAKVEIYSADDHPGPEEQAGS